MSGQQHLPTLPAWTGRMVARVRGRRGPQRTAAWVALGTTVVVNGLLLGLLSLLNRPNEQPPLEPFEVRRVTRIPPRPPTVATVDAPTPSPAAPSAAALPAPLLPVLDLPHIATGDTISYEMASTDLPALAVHHPVDLQVVIAGTPAGVAGDLTPATDALEVVDEPPVLINGFDFERFYPRNLRLRGVEGSSDISLEVGADGRVLTCSVISSEPPGAFSAAAQALGRSLRFTPARTRGIPVASTMRMTITWKLPR